MSISMGDSSLRCEGNARSNRARVTIKSTTYGAMPTNVGRVGPDMVRVDIEDATNCRNPMSSFSCLTQCE